MCAFCRHTYIKWNFYKFAAWIIIALLAMRWLVIAIITLQNNGWNVIQIWPDTVAIFVVIILIIIGTKKNQKIEIQEPGYDYKD
jgi:hypothetical protein